MTGNVKRPRVSGSEEFAAVVRKVVRRHQSHRFFTRCHVAVSHFSHKAFLRPFRMTIGRKGVIIRGTLIVIRSGGEKFMEELVKTVKRKI